jgi:hypothetical protein
MAQNRESITISVGPETDTLLKYIFRALPDELVDQVQLERITPEAGGVAKELITTAAVLSLSSAVAVQIFKLIGKWMEMDRQRKAVQLIYQASKENPAAMKVLADLEKHHAELSVKYGAIGAGLLKGKG